MVVNGCRAVACGRRVAALVQTLLVGSICATGVELVPLWRRIGARTACLVLNPIEWNGDVTAWGTFLRHLASRGLHPARQVALRGGGGHGRQAASASGLHAAHQCTGDLAKQPVFGLPWIFRN